MDKIGKICYFLDCFLKKFLDLSFNKLSIQSGVELGQTLEKNRTLQTLLLAWNELFSEKGI